MRIGRNELIILQLLMENEGQTSFFRIKEKLSGSGRLNWHKMGYDRWNEANIRHKALVRATKTLEEKGLIERMGSKSWSGRLSRVLRIKLTDAGKWNYLMRADQLKS